MEYILSWQAGPKLLKQRKNDPKIIRELGAEGCAPRAGKARAMARGQGLLGCQKQFSQSRESWQGLWLTWLLRWAIRFAHDININHNIKWEEDSTRSKSHFSGSLRPAWSLRFVRHGRTTAGCDRYEVAVHPAQTYCNRLSPVLWMSIWPETISEREFGFNTFCWIFSICPSRSTFPISHLTLCPQKADLIKNINWLPSALAFSWIWPAGATSRRSGSEGRVRFRYWPPGSFYARWLWVNGIPPLKATAPEKWPSLYGYTF